MRVHVINCVRESVCVTSYLEYLLGSHLFLHPDLLNALDFLLKVRGREGGRVSE